MQKSAGTHFAFAEYIAAAAFAKKAAERSDIMQRLVLPINNFKPTAGYKSKKYRSKFGFWHYGVDCVGGDTVYALGNGTVKLVGNDGKNGKTTGKTSGCGFVAIVVYRECANNKTEKPADRTVTYMHLREMPKVKAGQTVTKDTVIGYMGSTGAYTTGKHLHIQMDTDTRFWQYCAGLKRRSYGVFKFAKGGNVDSTVNPTDYLWVDKNQRVTAGKSEWYDRKEFANLPNI